jgi:hypothetical protein
MTHAVTILHRGATSREAAGLGDYRLHRAICSCGRRIGGWTSYEGEAIADAQTHEDRQPSMAILHLSAERIV